MKEIKTVAVIGAGLMGRQITLNTSMHGYQVTLNDSFPEALGKAENWVSDYLAGRVAKGKLTQEAADKAQKGLRYEAELQKAVEQADLVVEAIIEDRAAKEKLSDSSVILPPRMPFLQPIPALWCLRSLRTAWRTPADWPISTILIPPWS